MSTKRWVFENKKHDMDYSHMAMIARLPPTSAWNWIVVWQVRKGLETCIAYSYTASIMSN